jgi:hypothetical protein
MPAVCRATASSASNKRTFSLAFSSSVRLAGALGAFKIEVPDKTLDYRHFRPGCLGLKPAAPFIKAWAIKKPACAGFLENHL